MGSDANWFVIVPHPAFWCRSTQSARAEKGRDYEETFSTDCRFSDLSHQKKKPWL